MPQTREMRMNAFLARKQVRFSFIQLHSFHSFFIAETDVYRYLSPLYGWERWTDPRSVAQHSSRLEALQRSRQVWSMPCFPSLNLIAIRCNRIYGLILGPLRKRPKVFGYIFDTCSDGILDLLTTAKTSLRCIMTHDVNPERHRLR